MNTRIRRLGNAAMLLLASCLLASCASLVGPREIDLPLSRLQAGLDRRFPLDNRVLELFDIRLSRPQLSLLPDSQRVGLALEAYVAPPFLKQSWSGRLALSGRLYIDPARSQVQMADPRVDQFAIDGMDENLQRQLAKAVNGLMDHVARDVPVYTFRMEDLRYGGVQFVPTRIGVRRNALVVTIEPVR